MAPSTDGPDPATAASPDTPLKLGRYTIHELLGTGGMAEIYRASVSGPQQFQKWVVIKRVKPQFATQQVFVEMFIDEARINAALDHANIVHVFDFGELDGHYYMAMEYIDGIDLQVAHVRHKRRHSAPLPWEASLLVMRDVLRALDFAHTATDNDGTPLGIIHRDVNLVNIMLRRDGAVKLLDFGCARASSAIRRSRTQVGVIKGKLGYMSPEQAEDLELDPRTDVFSAGIVLHELLTGRRLFYGDSELDMLQAVKKKPIPDPRKYTPDLEPMLVDVVLRALERDRDRRYATASDMADALESILLQRRIPMSRVRDLMADLMAGDEAPESLQVSSRQRKVTVVTWLELPAQPTPPRLVSGELGSIDAASVSGAESEPVITTHQRWLEDEAPTPEEVTPPPGDDAPGDEAVPTLQFPAQTADSRPVPTPPSATPATPGGFGAASRELLVIIAIFVGVAVLVGLWVFLR